MLPLLKHLGFSRVIRKNFNVFSLFHLPQISVPFWVIQDTSLYGIAATQTEKCCGDKDVSLPRVLNRAATGYVVLGSLGESSMYVYNVVVGWIAYFAVRF